MSDTPTKGKKTRLANRDLALLIAEGHSADEIAAAHGISRGAVVRRLNDQGLDAHGKPMPQYDQPPPRELVVPWFRSDVSWVERAECRTGGYDPDMWHPEGRDAYRKPVALEAKAICNQRCDVRLDCLRDKLRTESEGGAKYRHGIAGGMTPDERARMAQGAVA